MKDYEYFVNRRNTPRLDLYTWLIGIAYGSVALNAITTFIYSNFGDKFLVLESLLFIVMVPIAVTDQKRANRGLSAVIGSEILLTIITIFYICGYSFKRLFIVYAFEMLFSILIIKIKPWTFGIKRKQKKSNKSDVALKQKNKRS